MDLDMRTLIFVVGIMHVMQVVVFIHQYVINKTFRGIGWWLLWSAAEVAGFTCMFLRNTPSLRTIAIIGQNALIVLGVLFVYVGIMRFFDKKESRTLVVSIFSVFLSALLYFLLIDDDIQMRSGIIFATLSAISFLSAHALLANKTRRLSVSVTFVAATFIVHGGYHAFRVALRLAGVPVDDMFAPTLLNAMTYLDAIIAATIWTFGFIIMINQRLTAEVTEAKEEVERIFDISPDAVAITRLSDGLFVKVNEGFCAVSGFTRAEVLGKTGRDVALWKNPDDRQRITDALRENGVCENFEAVFRRRDGRAFCGLISAKIFNLKDAPHVLSMTRDITDRKRMEDDLQKMQKLQSVGTLAGGIAHDFNNILQGLYGNIAFAKEDLPKNHPACVSLEEAEKSMGRAVRLTKQLLTFAKGGAPVKEDVDLGALVKGAAQFDLSGSNVSLVFRQADDLWQVHADRAQLQQVVSCLVINARQAMPDGGHLAITLENADLPQAAVPGLRQGRFVKVTVRDDGPGIEPAVLGRIFDPYFTTRQTGHGLGLTTAYSIITKHGGHIGVESEPGQGATFTFYLPADASAQAPEAGQAAAERPAPAPSRPARLLVMDDEETIRELAARMLTPCGYSVATAPDGQEALGLFQGALEAGTPFDAVILDLTIPGGIGGKDVVKALLALDPDVLAIVSSGYAEDPVMADPAAYGFKGAAAKPYTAEALRAVVARVLA